MISVIRSKFVFALVVAALSSVVSGSTAEARGCSSEIRSNLLEGLSAIASDPKHPADNRKNAAEAVAVIRGSLQLDCKIEPFQREGARAELDTNTHHLSIFIFEKRIVAFDVKPKRMQ